MANYWHWDYVVQLYIADDESSFCTAGFDIPNVIYRCRFIDTKQR